MNRGVELYRKSPYWGGPGGSRNIIVARKRTIYKRKRFVKGRDRTIGNYLRYTGPRPEQKFLDLTLLDAEISTTASVISSLNLMAQGLTGDTRIGRKITVRKLHVRFELFLPQIVKAVATKTSDIVRVMFFIDKQTNGVATAGSDILKDNTDYLSFRLLSNQGRFEILYDKFHELNYKTLGVDQDPSEFTQIAVSKFYKFSKKLSVPIEFSGISGAITEVRSNNIGILAISRGATAVLTSKVRLRFSDG